MTSITVDGIEYRFFNHLYAVSRCGKVLRKLRPYAPSLHNGGYLSMGSKHLVHRVVAECWMPNFDPAKQIHHINHDKTDNRLENLECLTREEHLKERHADMLAMAGRYVRTEESKEKIRQARLGSVTSEETKAKQRAALLGRKRPYFSRAAHSEESRAKRSEAHVRNTRCRIEGVEYRSFAAAALATGVHRFTIRKRCLSKNFPDYELVL
jgi:hypothetical protein